MATITKTVKASGGDYTSLAAWDAGEAQDLTDAGGDIAVADVYILQDTTSIYFLNTNWTTSAACYISIVVNAASRHDGKYNTSKYRLERSGETAIYCDVPYARFDGLQIKVSGVSGHGFYVPAPAGDMRITNCIVDTVGSATDQPVGLQTGDAITVKVNNCLFYSSSLLTAPAYIGLMNGSSGTLYIENCLVYNMTYGIYNAAGTSTAKNVGVLECATAFLGTVGQTTCSTTTPTFVDEAAFDFHLDAADTTWINQGTDLSADAGWVLGAVDIDGQTRSGTWDIGADEYVTTAVAFIPRVVGII